MSVSLRVTIGQTGETLQLDGRVCHSKLIKTTYIRIYGIVVVHLIELSSKVKNQIT